MSKETLKYKDISIPVSDEEIKDLLNSERVKKLLEWLSTTNLPKLDIENVKKAYPNNDPYIPPPKGYDHNKWMNAAKSIYSQYNNGEDKTKALINAIGSWDIVEKHSFINWLRFYQEGAHLKYKFANLWYENGSPGYFLEIKSPTPAPTGSDLNHADPEAEAQKEESARKHRKKMLGRLTSLEKLLQDDASNKMFGKELGNLLDAIYDLKKKFHTLNSTSYVMYDDLIIRQSNICKKQGFYKAAEALYSISEEAVLNSPSPNPPNQGSGSAGGLPSMGPGMPQAGQDSAPNNAPDFTEPQGEQQSPAIADFLKNMNNDEDDVSKADVLEVEDRDGILITEAQAAEIPGNSDVTAPKPTPATAPVATPSVEKATVTKKPETIEVTEDDVTDKFDKKMGAILSGLTVQDVIEKLEDVANVFRVRKLPRELSMIDIMLDHLGLASFFPALSESINKSLESNNYIASRIDDILSKLRGTVKTHEFDLEHDQTTNNPELESIKNKLDQDAKKEKARKEMRKEQEMADLELNNQAPDIEVTEEEAAPLASPTPAAPTAPVTNAPKPV